MHAIQRRFNHLITFEHPDPDTQRRGRAVIVICIIFLIACIPSIPIPALVQGNTLSSIVLLFVPPLFIALIVVARRGYINIAAYGVLVIIFGALIATAITAGEINAEPFFLSLTIITASMLLRPWGVALITLLCFVCMGWFWNSMVQSNQVNLTPQGVVIYGALLCCFASVYGIIGAYTTNRTLIQINTARELAEMARQEAEEAKNQLEQRVAERTSELRTSLTAQEQQSQQLAEALRLQQHLASQLLDLSIPVIPFRKDALIVPLIGAIDSTRASELITRVLSQIEQHHAQTIIIDITGVPLIDTQIAATLIQTAQAARLLGARPVLVGIRPEVAFSLVGLGVDLNLFRSAATLQQALE
ncbi:MAG: STAS domain-containing protein [Roseiflexaceae bacterium]